MMNILVEEKLEFPFGIAYCNQHYVYFERAQGFNLSANDAKILLDDIYVHFGKRKFVFISHRKSATTIDLNSYKHINQRQIMGIAIVSDDQNLEMELLKEQSLFEGPFALFKTLEQAIAWADTFELD